MDFAYLLCFFFTHRFAFIWKSRISAYRTRTVSAEGGDRLVEALPVLRVMLSGNPSIATSHIAPKLLQNGS